MDFNQALLNITRRPNSVTFFLAPMGWGKTRSIWELARNGEKIIFVSPLRSIIEQLKEREGVIFFEEGVQKEKTLEKFKKSKSDNILLITPESLSSALLAKIMQHDYLFVLDEFHLFYDWGESFREKLFDFFREIVCEEKRILAMTASLTEKLRERVIDDLGHSNPNVTFIDVGNFEFNNRPTMLIYLKDIFLKFILWIHIFIYFQGRIIVFVPTRKCVAKWKEKLRELSIDSHSCVGGEVRDFTQKELKKSPRIIISTSALSHGVNIENVRRVFVLYRPEEATGFQMFGRGGRFGESFKVFALCKKDTTS
ncbi:DEAD/DEAH box helicase [Bacteriovorax sp. Seq25_V]|uniref:DEAD/DEAH box helicase n=1 Tax=Bacteriovorax sp. Seq25_V TaxID=1201288 RepID=UPI00038A55B9|nr:DEAD/DEAH box helicase [Bacteriovorax sp. Seq25_V]EQC44697.1 DEAD/DEAH box helicase [Bacteriovorax sp. Seq25_V]